MLLPHARTFFWIFYSNDDMFDDHEFYGDHMCRPVSYIIPVFKSHCGTRMHEERLYWPPDCSIFDDDCSVQVVVFKDCCDQCGVNLDIAVIEDGSYDGGVVCDCVCELGETDNSAFGVKFEAYCTECFEELSCGGNDPGMIACEKLPFHTLRKIRALITDVDDEDL